MTRRAQHAGSVLLCVLALTLAACAQPGDREPDGVMGDYQGTLTAADGSERPVVAQVICWGQEGYQTNILPEFDTRAEALAVLRGELEGEVVFFGDAARIEGGVFSGAIDAGRFEMIPVVRLSETLGLEPPEGAVVLFDGTSLDAWDMTRDRGREWRIVDDAMEVTAGAGSLVSKESFDDMRLHLEFRTPFEPDRRGQGRGNSGVYFQARYEVQVLDSYGLYGHDNECGGLYAVSEPLVNMCAPPLQWQTYDAEFHAPRRDPQTGEVSDARLTLRHNGVLIHDDVHMAADLPEGVDVQLGPLLLQDHGNPVQYRNIWVAPLDVGGGAE